MHHCATHISERHHGRNFYGLQRMRLSECYRRLPNQAVSLKRLQRFSRASLEASSVACDCCIGCDHDSRQGEPGSALLLLAKVILYRATTWKTNLAIACVRSSASKRAQGLEAAERAFVQSWEKLSRPRIPARTQAKPRRIGNDWLNRQAMNIACQDCKSRHQSTVFRDSKSNSLQRAAYSRG